MKKLLSALFVLLLIAISLTAIPFRTNAATDGYYTYSISNGEATITDVDTAISGSITIPSTLGGYPVTTIGSSAFSYCYSLTSITIPDSVTTIGNDAFFSCKSLVEITIPDSVTTIGSAAFRYCSSLTSITIPDSVTSIDDYAFCNCTRLTGIWVDEDNLFYSSNNRGVLFNKDQTVLIQTPGAFSGSYTIPDSVTTIGDCAFQNCSSLTSVTISDSVTTIESAAFFYCTSLVEITIPDSVTAIGSAAFAHSGLTAIAIPNNVTTISNNAFYDCICLADITIPDSVTTIGNHAFYYCHSLADITIPDSVTSIRAYAFYDCGLTSVTYCGTEEQWNAIRIREYNTALIDAERSYHNWQDATCTKPKTCTVCGSTEGEVSGHSYVTEILERPSLTKTGKQKKVCSVCGDTVTEMLDMLVGEVSGWNVTLCDDLRVTFHLNISQSIESTARVRIVVGEEGHTFRVSGLEKTEDGLYIASVNIAAAQMTDFIFVTVINGSDLAETASYTVRGYADTILADEDYSQYHQLVREMLNYGAAAQVYFDYEKENLANEGIANTGSVEIPDSVDNELSVAGNAEGVTFYGASLIFRNKIAVRYYFRFIGDINDCSFVEKDTTYAPQLKDGLYYIEIKDILPQNLDEEIALTVTDANGNSLTVRYNPMNYIVRMNEKGSDTLKALVKALYNYHLAAKAVQETV